MVIKDSNQSRVHLLGLGVICVTFVGISMVGIGWGLPSRSIDPFLFGGDEPWPGEKIYRLSGAGAKFSPERGADVDPDPLQRLSPEPVPLTETEKQLVKISASAGYWCPSGNVVTLVRKHLLELGEVVDVYVEVAVRVERRAA